MFEESAQLSTAADVLYCARARCSSAEGRTGQNAKRKNKRRMPKQEAHRASRLGELTGAITSVELKPLKQKE